MEKSVEKVGSFTDPKDADSKYDFLEDKYDKISMISKEINEFNTSYRNKITDSICSNKNHFDSYLEYGAVDYNTKIKSIAPTGKLLTNLSNRHIEKENSNRSLSKQQEQGQNISNEKAIVEYYDSLIKPSNTVLSYNTSTIKSQHQNSNNQLAGSHKISLIEHNNSSSLPSLPLNIPKIPKKQPQKEQSPIVNLKSRNAGGRKIGKIQSLGNGNMISKSMNKIIINNHNVFNISSDSEMKNKLNNYYKKKRPCNISSVTSDLITETSEAVNLLNSSSTFTLPNEAIINKYAMLQQKFKEIETNSTLSDKELNTEIISILSNLNTLMSNLTKSIDLMSPQIARAQPKSNLIGQDIVKSSTISSKSNKLVKLSKFSHNSDHVPGKITDNLKKELEMLIIRKDQISDINYKDNLKEEIKLIDNQVIIKEFSLKRLKAMKNTNEKRILKLKSSDSNILGTFLKELDDINSRNAEADKRLHAISNQILVNEALLEMKANKLCRLEEELQLMKNK